MIEAILVSAVIGAFAFLFQKAKTKQSALIKFGIMLFLEVILFFTMIFGTTDMDSELMVIILLTIISIGSFIGYKIYKIYLQIKEDNFPNDDKKE